MTIEQETRFKTAKEMLDLAKVSIAKLKYIGISDERASDELFQAYNAFKSNEYDTAYKFAAKAKKDADSLKNLYKDTCIAMASASDCLRDAKNNQKDITHPLQLLIGAKKSFEENNFNKAYKLAVSSCAEAAKITGVDINIMNNEEKRVNTKILRICKWRIPLSGSSVSVCLNMLGPNYKKRCYGNAECPFLNDQGS